MIMLEGASLARRVEYGVADLRGLGEAERARRIAAVASPDHRDRLLSRLNARRVFNLVR